MECNYTLQEELFVPLILMIQPTSTKLLSISLPTHETCGEKCGHLLIDSLQILYLVLRTVMIIYCYITNTLKVSSLKMKNPLSSSQTCSLGRVQQYHLEWLS